MNANIDRLQSEFKTAGITLNTYSLGGEYGDQTVESLRQDTALVVNELRYTQVMLRSQSSRFTAV
jgi:hypothetical protein